MHGCEPSGRLPGCQWSRHAEKQALEAEADGLTDTTTGASRPVVGRMERMRFNSALVIPHVVAHVLFAVCSL